MTPVADVEGLNRGSLKLPTVFLLSFHNVSRYFHRLVFRFDPSQDLPISLLPTSFTAPTC